MTIIPSTVGCRPGRLCPQLRSRDGDSFYSRTDQDEIDTRNEIPQKLAKESIPRFVSPEESAVAPQKFKSRRQSLPQPVAGFELAGQREGGTQMPAKITT
jgi:hypothetical protein